MSVLETFFYLFDADARKLEQGLKEADRQNDKLKEGLDKTDVAASMVGKSLLNLAYSAGAALGGILSIGAIARLTFDVANFVDEMADAADAIGIGVDQLHAWELAVQASDGEQGAFTASLNQFNIGIQDIATKGKGRLLPFLKELGLSMADVKEASKDPTTALLKMSDTFAGLSKAQAAGLGAKIGLDQGTINLLTKGRIGVEELIAQQREFGVITKEDAEEAGKFDLEMKKWSATWATVKRDIGMVLIPSMTWFFDKLRAIVNWMTDHKAAVAGFFIGISAVLVGVFLPAITAAAAGTWALIAPFLPIIAAVVAFGAVLGLIVDDLYNFMQGNDSVIGELAKKWPIIGDVIRGIGDAMVFFIELARSLFAAFVTLLTDGPQAAIEGFANSIRAVVEDIASRFPIVGEAFELLTGDMAEAIRVVVDIWQWLVDKVSAGIGLFMRGVEMVRNLHGAGARALGFSYAERPEAPRQAAATPRAAPRPLAPVPAAPATPRPARGAPARAPRTPRPVAAMAPPAAPRRALLDTRTGEVVPAATRRPTAIVDTSTPEGRATRAGVEGGRQQLALTASPIVAQSSSAIANTTTNRTTSKQTTVQIDRIDVNTQATDGEGVANALTDKLGAELRGAIDQTDDGVLA